VTPILRRRLVALAAAYAIALQAVVGSFAVVTAMGAVPGLCASGASHEPGSDPRHQGTCVVCPTCCGDGGFSGVAPGGVCVPAPHGKADRVVRGMHLAERSAPRNLPPSRAPPTA